MIPRAQIVAWRKHAPWKFDDQIEKDLILSRMLIELFSDRRVSENFAFRGGTALHKLFLPRPARYSEDIDLVLVTDLKSEEVINTIIKALMPFLGKPIEHKWRMRDAFFRYSIEAEIPPPERFNVKVDIACYDRPPLGQLEKAPFIINTPGYSRSCDIITYNINELLGTKLRALLQRNIGRDLFDIWYGITNASIDPREILRAFSYYTWEDPITREGFRAIIKEKAANPIFRNDTQDLLRSDITYDIETASALIDEILLSCLTTTAR